jgi:hypothetical protein
MVAVALTSAGCPGGTDPEPDTDPDTQVDPTPEPLLLDPTHEGWGQAQCWTCHVEDAHNTGLDPYGCASCHTSNGASAGHTAINPCSKCHGEPHGSTGFPDPEACETCHVR